MRGAVKRQLQLRQTLGDNIITESRIHFNTHTHTLILIHSNTHTIREEDSDNKQRGSGVEGRKNIRQTIEHRSEANGFPELECEFNEFLLKAEAGKGESMQRSSSVTGKKGGQAAGKEVINNLPCSDRGTQLHSGQ